jgi:hypothetical protein
MARALTAADRSYVQLHRRAQKKLLTAPKGQIEQRRQDLRQLTTDKLKQEMHK